MVNRTKKKARETYRFLANDSNILYNFVLESIYHCRLNPREPLSDQHEQQESYCVEPIHLLEMDK